MQFVNIILYGRNNSHSGRSFLFCLDQNIHGSSCFSMFGSTKWVLFHKFKSHLNSFFAVSLMMGMRKFPNTLRIKNFHVGPTHTKQKLDVRPFYPYTNWNLVFVIFDIMPIFKSMSQNIPSTSALRDKRPKQSLSIRFRPQSSFQPLVKQE